LSLASSPVLFALALVACSGSEERVRTVTREEYVSPTCWFDAQGDFVAFLFYHAGNGRAMAAPISGKCMEEPGRRGLGLTTARQIGIVDLVDRRGVLQRFFPGVVLADSTITDQEIPASTTKVYFVRARVAPVPMPGGPVYTAERILRLDDLNLTIEQFMELTAAERESLWRAHHSPS
jgi:hypothetical protein